MNQLLTVRNQLATAKVALKNISFRGEAASREIAEEALATLAQAAKMEPRKAGFCKWCDEGLVRTKFNSLFQHTLENGDDVTCQASGEKQ